MKPLHNSAGHFVPNIVDLRFLSHFKRGDECWEWTGKLSPSGYGRINIANKVHLAHRYSWSMFVGKIPHGTHVCHHCDNPKCVRPDHLFLGNDAANNADKVAKNRQTKGEQVWISKLTATDVIAMRQMRAGGMMFKDIARCFGVHTVTALDAINGKTWKHV